LTIITDDEALTVAHEAPECAWFKSAMAAHPSAETQVVPADAMSAHLDAIAGRRRT
jgi:hypothetical protein